MKKLLKSHQVAKLLNVWPHTLLRTAGGHRCYKESLIMVAIGIDLMEQDENKSPPEELIEDMPVIVTSISARNYGKRDGRVAKKLTEMIEQEVAAGENHG